MSKYTRRGRAAARVLGAIRGPHADKLLWAEAIKFAQLRSDKRVGMPAIFPGDEVCGELAAIEGGDCRVRYPDHEVVRPLAEVFDPNVVRSYLRNLSAPGGPLGYDPEAPEGQGLFPLKAGTILDGPPPDLPDVDPTMHAAIVAGWHGLRVHQAERRPGWVGLCLSDKTGTLSVFLPADRAREIVADATAVDPQTLAGITPAPSGVLRLVVLTPGAIGAVDLPLGAAERPAPTGACA